MSYGAQGRMRAITAVVLVMILAAIVYVQRSNLTSGRGKDAILIVPRLDCPVSDMFSATMGHSQPLHDKSGATAVQMARIMPNVALVKWTKPADFDSAPYGRVAATICATQAYPKLMLTGGKPGNELWLHHTGNGDGVDNWQAFVRTVGSNDFHQLIVYRRDTTDDATKHPPGHAQWIDGDENIWVSCSKGCCYVSSGTRDST